MSQTHTPDPITIDAARAINTNLPEGDLSIAGVATPLPPTVTEMLRQILSALAAGEPVVIITPETILTPNEAAEFLGVSRGFVTKLMDEGTLPYHHVGTHRRIPGAAAAIYKSRQTAVAKAAMDELVRISEALGDYANPPPLPPKSAFKNSSGRDT